MGVDVAWEGTDGTIETISDPEGLLGSALESLHRGECGTLQRIDIYHRAELPPGDALIDEMTLLRDRTPDPDTREHLSRVLSLFRRAATRPDTTITFMGD
jgi:hypothetical protein